MTCIIKRSCNSSILRKEEKITFNSWIITIEGKDRTRFAAIVKRLIDDGMVSPDLPDVEGKVLGHILEIGLVHMTTEEDE